MPEIKKLVYFSQRHKLREHMEQRKTYEDVVKAAELGIKKRIIRSLEEGDRELLFKKFKQISMLEDS